MLKTNFELNSVRALRDKYGLVAENRPTVVLNSDSVPPALRHLIPYAELWGISDDLIRDDLVRRAPKAALDELRQVVRENEDLLDDWLAGSEAAGPRYSPEYTAFSAMRMAADFS